MSLKKTHEQFISELYEINPTIEVLSKYQSSLDYIKVRCKQCGYVWNVTPHNLLSGKGCKQCAYIRSANKLKKTDEEFISEMSDKSPNIIILGTYKNTQTPVRCKCRVCGFEWNARPYNLLTKMATGCPECAKKIRGDKTRKTNEQFVKELYKTNPDIEALQEYRGAFREISCRCKKCKHIWKTTPNTLLNAQSGCPFCYSSYGEQKISNFLDLNNVQYISQVKFDKLVGVGGNKLSYDFYIPSKNLLIEYQGQFHDGTVSFQTNEEYKTQKEHDRRKKNYSISHNINLLEIWYYDYKNINAILSKELTA